MPKTTMEEEALYKLPADVPMEAALVSVKERVIPFKNKKGQDDSFTKWEWEFEILEGEYAGLHAWGDTEDRLTTREDNKVRQWAEVLLGREFELGEGLDTDDLLGLTCVLTVKNTPYEKKDGNVSYLCPVDQLFPKGSLPADPWGSATADGPWASGADAPF